MSDLQKKIEKILEPAAQIVQYQELRQRGSYKGGNLVEPLMSLFQEESLKRLESFTERVKESLKRPAKDFGDVLSKDTDELVDEIINKCLEAERNQ